MGLMFLICHYLSRLPHFCLVCSDVEMQSGECSPNGVDSMRQVLRMYQGSNTVANEYFI